MKKTNSILLIALVIQGVLALGFWLSYSSPSTPKASAPLISEQLLAANKLVITGQEDKAVLNKQGDTWTLENYGQLSVASRKMDTFLDKLKQLKIGWPVATTEAAAKRFEVDDTNSQKTLAFYNGDTLLAKLYLGTSPAYKRLHVRMDGDKNIYAVNLGQHDVSADAASWFDNTIMQFAPSPESASITWENDKLLLTKVDDIWTFKEGERSVSANEDHTNTWLNHFQSLRVKSLVLSQDEAEKITVQNPILKVSLSNNDTSVDYAFYSVNETTYIKRYGQKELYELSSYEADGIINTNKTDFTENNEVSDSEND
ncbi:DUF4340 domain-containing protein [Teredinibacter sp. KSP-S5-2]|uniref:DUF4340 domain-containing protein n=1 Tax=Teredinibacter sp. KSP-S5-2 TaxID=3034506 RepID=UPI002934D3FD|nr:DUF4340 domain-containing protein [Teredinibacter sp. KSP-S5-2]WNO07745.1 DUF4340 domain-containing protein [Teredinibacter sp. KSP-S5-2]